MPKTPVSAFTLVFSSGVNAPYSEHIYSRKAGCVFFPLCRVEYIYKSTYDIFPVIIVLMHKN